MSWQSAARFYRQLGMITRTGISLTQALTMAGGVAGGRHSALAGGWSDGCSRGSDLASQLRAAHEDPLTAALIQAGEKSGRLPEMAQMIADHFEHLMKLRSEIISRLIYPVLVLLFALMIPAVPGIFINGSPFWHVLVGPFALGVLAVVAVGFVVTTHRSGLLARLALSKPLVFFSMPLILTNTCRVLRAGFAAGMLVPDALELASGACGNRSMRARLEQAAVQVRGGGIPDLASAMTSAGFPLEMVQLIANGETAGRSEEVLMQVATVSEESFRIRSTYAARIFTGTIYGIAMLVASLVIIGMVSKYYIQPIKDLNTEMNN